MDINGLGKCMQIGAVKSWKTTSSVLCAVHPVHYEYLIGSLSACAVFVFIIEFHCLSMKLTLCVVRFI